MTSLEDFHISLANNPHDFNLMAVYADFLEEEAGPITCTECNGSGSVTTSDKHGYIDYPIACRKCDNGSINHKLAIGYRALATVRPVFDLKNHCWWGWQSGFPAEWWAKLSNTGRAQGGVVSVQEQDTMKALDRAALAFASLHEDVRHKVLTTGPWAQQGSAT